MVSQLHIYVQCIRRQELFGGWMHRCTASQQDIVDIKYGQPER